jgi:hypothetical protein
MAKSTVSDTRKRPPGRPAVGSTGIMVRMPPSDLVALDRWIAKQPEELTRPEALRVMMAMVIELGLKAKAK